VHEGNVLRLRQKSKQRFRRAPMAAPREV
jgi:hypothetical protein